MKKPSLLMSALLAGAMTFISCNDKEESPSPTGNQEIFDFNSIASTSEVSRFIFNDGDIIELTYDADGKVKSVEETWESSQVSDDYTVTWSGTGNYDLTYSNGKLTAINYSGQGSETTTSSPDGPAEVFEWNETATLTYVYNDENLVQKLTINWVEEEETEDRLLEYDANNRIVKQTDYYDGGVAEDDYRVFEWDGQNLTKEINYETSSNSGGRIKNGRMSRLKKHSLLSGRVSRNNNDVMESETVLSQFDDKINPFNILGVIYGEIEGQFISENNFGKMVRSDYDAQGNINWQLETTASYEYDSEGRPVKATFTEEYNNETEVESVTIEYRN